MGRIHFRVKGLCQGRKGFLIIPVGMLGSGKGKRREESIGKLVYRAFELPSKLSIRRTTEGAKRRRKEPRAQAQKTSPSSFLPFLPDRLTFRSLGPCHPLVPLRLRDHKLPQSRLVMRDLNRLNGRRPDRGSMPLRLQRSLGLTPGNDHGAFQRRRDRVHSL